MTSHPLSTCRFKGQHALLSSASADTPPSTLLPSPLPSPLGKQSSPRGSHVADHTMHQPCSHSVQTPILSVSFCSFCSKHLLALPGAASVQRGPENAHTEPPEELGLFECCSLGYSNIISNPGPFEGWRCGEGTCRLNPEHRGGACGRGN